MLLHHLFTLILFRSISAIARAILFMAVIIHLACQLISIFSLIFLHLACFAPYLVFSINPNNLLLFPSITDRNSSRPAMILPLHLTSPDSSISSFNPRRQLQRSESQHHPNARMRLYDDLLINGLLPLFSFISCTVFIYMFLIDLFCV